MDEHGVPIKTQVPREVIMEITLHAVYKEKNTTKMHCKK